MDRLLLFLYYMTPPPPNSTLFPYATLFRSFDEPVLALRAHQRLAFDHFELGDLAGVDTHLHAYDRRDRRARSDRTRRSEEHTSELQSQPNIVCRRLFENKKTYHTTVPHFVRFDIAKWIGFSCFCIT